MGLRAICLVAWFYVMGTAIAGLYKEAKDGDKFYFVIEGFITLFAYTKVLYYLNLMLN